MSGAALGMTVSKHIGKQDNCQVAVSLFRRACEGEATDRLLALPAGDLGRRSRPQDGPPAGGGDVQDKAEDRGRPDLSRARDRRTLDGRRLWRRCLPPRGDHHARSQHCRRIERDHQDLGLASFEGQGRRGFHPHATLCIAAESLLVAERVRLPASEPAKLLKTLPLPGDRPPIRQSGTRDLDRYCAPLPDRRPHPTAEAMSLLHGADASTAAFVTQSNHRPRV